MKFHLYNMYNMRHKLQLEYNLIGANTTEIYHNIIHSIKFK